MPVQFSERAWRAYVDWQADDAAVAERINALIEDIRRHPFTGLGKPEPLRFELKGWWSRRIDREHRLVYKVTGDTITVAQCRFHYGDK